MHSFIVNFLVPLMLAILVGIIIFLAGCVSLHSDEVTLTHWQSCQRYCAPAAVKAACDSWKGSGCECSDRREIYFDLEEFEDD